MGECELRRGKVMAKTFEGTIEINVPKEIAYQHIKEFFSVLYDSKSEFSTLKKSQYTVYNDKPDECFCFQEKASFAIAKYEIYFKSVTESKTMVSIKVTLPWSFIRKVVGQATILNLKSHFKVLEKHYDSFSKYKK